MGVGPGTADHIAKALATLFICAILIALASGLAIGVLIGYFWGA